MSPASPNRVLRAFGSGGSLLGRKFRVKFYSSVGASAAGEWAIAHLTLSTPGTSITYSSHRISEEPCLERNKTCSASPAAWARRSIGQPPMLALSLPYPILSGSCSHGSFTRSACSISLLISGPYRADRKAGRGRVAGDATVGGGACRNEGGDHVHGDARAACDATGDGKIACDTTQGGVSLGSAGIPASPWCACSSAAICRGYVHGPSSVRTRQRVLPRTPMQEAPALPPG